jgi:anti-sigma factor RsiW
MTCRDFIEFLMQYLSGELSEAERKEFDHHLSICRACVAYVKAYRQTVELGRTAFVPSESQVPADVPEELIGAILSARRKSR